MFSLGFSPCPNDTFIFHGLVHGLIGDNCPDFSAPILADVETLNQWALQGKLDVTKLSFHAFGHVLDDYILLGAGSALGRGCGPLLVAAKPLAPAELAGKRVAIPGKYTTAAMLLQLFTHASCTLVPMPFETIMPMVAGGDVDAGVIIHESRFTFQQHGLVCLQDLGSWWEEESGHAIPLGGIVAKRSLGQEMLKKIDNCIRTSVRFAFQYRQKSSNYIKQHAQELDDQVIASHINLYVNDFSENLGEQGVAAINEFLRRGRAEGLFPASGKKMLI